MLQDMVDQAAEEGDIRARPQRHVDVGQRAGPGESGVNVDDRRTALPERSPRTGDDVALPRPFGDHVHGGVEVEILPLRPVRPPVPDLGHPGR